MQSIINPAIDLNEEIVGGSGNRKIFHESIRNKDQLIITIGDSWTWGCALGKQDEANGIFDDYDYRTTSIYGCHLATMLDCDFVNIAFPGASNIGILNKAFSFINGITKNYKKIYLVITLTENGRELIFPGFLECENEYNQIRGESWPTYRDIITNTTNTENIDIVLEELADGRYGNELANKLKFFIALNQSTDLTDFFNRYDNYVISYIYEKLNKLDDRILCVVGRNFTSFATDELTQSPNIVWIHDIWTDIIAKNGSLPQYPTSYAATYLMSIQNIIHFIHKIGIKVTTEELMIKLLQPAEEIIVWCDNSPYNSKFASRHPNEQAHLWWAEHLYKCIEAHQNNNLK